MSKEKPRLIIAGLLVVALAVAPAAADAKKKKSKTVNITQSPNATVPDAVGAVNGQLDSTISVGNKFKGLKIRDVNVTVQTTGTAAGAANDLLMRLTSPAGASNFIVINLSGQSIGPLTLDDESNGVITGGGAPTGKLLLNPPYNGTAQPGNNGQGKPLAMMDNERVKGTWTLSVFDDFPGLTSVLNSWTLNVRAGRPYASD